MATGWEVKRKKESEGAIQKARMQIFRSQSTWMYRPWAVPNTFGVVNPLGI